MTSLVAVTGSTGRLGSRVAARLAAVGMTQRLVVRDPSRAPQLAGAEVRQADYADGEASRLALEGAQTLFMVSGEENADRVAVHRTFIDAAAAAGVEHVVYTSFLGAAPDATFTLGRHHWATEEHLRASGMRWTLLRDNLYLDFLPLIVGDDGVIRGPAGQGRLAAVAIDDIADVAAVVLQDPAAHTGRTYDLTGPDAVTLHEAARTLARHMDRPVGYHAESLEEAYESRRQYGAPDWQVEAWVTTYTAIAAGEMARISDDVERVTGHAARSLADLFPAGGDG